MNSDTLRNLFLSHNAQTSPFPLLIEMTRAKGSYMWDANGKKYIDFISGIGVSNIGHLNSNVVKAVNKQLKEYMHLMVYGEFVQSPQVLLAKALTDLLPAELNCCYFVNSGAEAIDGAMKLVKKVTGRREIAYFENAYHGSSQGPLSLMGQEKLKQDFRPLLPMTKKLRFNEPDDLNLITSSTAAVFIEPVQGEAGVREFSNDYLMKLRNRCTETGTLLVFDEIQTAFGRTGTFFAFEQTSVTPDVICLSKAMGGGMPIGAFISHKAYMKHLSDNPVLGHITTFGGHPVCCAASLAAVNFLQKSELIHSVFKKEKLIRKHLKNPNILEIRGKGLMLAIQFKSEEFNLKVIMECINQGLMTDWFLFNSAAMRLAPPLTITSNEIKIACQIIQQAISKTLKEV